jgi:hypothetical protein
VTERVSVTVAGFPNLTTTKSYDASAPFESLGVAPAPTSVETLRHIADTISGDGAFIMQGILRKAADELESVRANTVEECAMPAGYVMVDESDFVPHIHPQYGPGMFCTEDCIKSGGGR